MECEIREDLNSLYFLYFLQGILFYSSFFTCKKKHPFSCLKKNWIIIKLYKQRAGREISQKTTAELSSIGLELGWPRHQFCSRKLKKRSEWSCPPKLCHTHCSVLVHACLPLCQPWKCFLCFHLKLQISFISLPRCLSG